MSFICGSDQAPGEALRVLSKLMGCCYGSANEGPMGCTCWEVDYDLEQAELQRELPAQTRSEMCENCAYRPDSPERAGDDRYVVPPDFEGGTGTFWCHTGIRKPVRFRHPAGIIVEADGEFYKPLIIRRANEAIPFKADGTPAERCAGWAAFRKAEAARS